MADHRSNSIGQPRGRWMEIPMDESLTSPSSVELNRALSEQLRTAPEVNTLPLHTLQPLSLVMGAGHIPNSLPLVHTGRLQITLHLSEEGDRVVPISFGPGELALSSTLFAAEPLSGDLIATEATSVQFIPKWRLEALLANDPALVMCLAKFYAARLREVQSRERGFLVRSVHGRVVAALSRASTSAVPPGRVHLTHEELAAWAGLSRSRVSVELKRMEQQGYLKLHRGAIELIQLPIL